MSVQLLLLILVITSSCNEQQFYEKDFLETATEKVPTPKIETPDTTTPTTTQPDTTAPTTTQPDTTAPTTTQPSTTAPTTTQPGTTAPTTTQPDTTAPTTTQPDTTAPTTTQPEDNTGGDNSDDDEVTQTGPCGSSTPFKHTDLFTQNIAQAAKVDILWVVDNSGSMGNEQDALADNFNVFIQDFITRNIDFQMAIATTDRDGTNAVAQESIRSLTSQAAKQNQNRFMTDFKSLIHVGIHGSGREKGIDSSLYFLEKYNTWVRDDAYLVIVYISDEEDQSTKTVNNYLGQLKSLKNEADQLKVYSIVTQDTSAKKRWETIGHRYMELSSATNGPSADIHQDFHQILKGFGESIVELVSSFNLKYAPINQEVDVKVESAAVTKDQYSYISESNAVTFNEHFIPAQGSLIELSYETCGEKDEDAQ